MKLYPSRLLLALTAAGGVAFVGVAPADAALVGYNFETAPGGATGTDAATSSDPAVTASTFTSIGGEASPSLQFSTFGVTTSEQVSIIERDVATSTIVAGGSEFFSFTVSSGNFLDLDSITLDANQIGAGNTIGLNVSSSLDGHATLLDAGFSSGATSFQAVTFDLSDDAALQGLDASGGVEFRIYYSNSGSTSGSVGVRIDTVALNGTVGALIPEPASVALLSLGGLLVLGRRRPA